MAENNVDLNKIKEQLSLLTIKEMVALTDSLKEEWNISAIATVASGPAAPVETAAEKTDFDVILVSAGDKKIEVIKTVRTIRSDLGLKEAKELVDSAPATIKQAVAKDVASKMKEDLENVGAKVEIK